MAQADDQDLAMEQDPEDVILKEDEEVEMDHEIQEHVDDELQAGDGVKAVVAQLHKAPYIELQEDEVIQVDDVQVHTAEVVQVAEMLQEDQVIQPYLEIMAKDDEGHSQGCMQDVKYLEGQAGNPVQIPYLEQVKKVPEVGVQCR